MRHVTLPAVPAAVPLYQVVKRQMLSGLKRGDWKPGAAIPSERQLAQRYGISIGTLRRAIDELCAENILIRQQGRGTFVASHTRDRMLFHFFHIVSDRGPKEYPDVHLQSFARAKADRTAADRLGIDAGAPVCRIRNLLLLDRRPVILDDITLPTTRFPGLTERQFRSRRSTIYNLYQEAFAISVVKTTERLRATLADAQSAALLAVAVGTPLLQIRRLALTYQDDPVEYRVSLVNTEAHEYWAEIGPA